jgi:hypothetical protein
VTRKWQRRGGGERRTPKQAQPTQRSAQRTAPHKAERRVSKAENSKSMERGMNQPNQKPNQWAHLSCLVPLVVGLLGLAAGPNCLQPHIDLQAGRQASRGVSEAQTLRWAGLPRLPLGGALLGGLEPSSHKTNEAGTMAPGRVAGQERVEGRVERSLETWLVYGRWQGWQSAQAPGKRAEAACPEVLQCIT